MSCHIYHLSVLRNEIFLIYYALHNKLFFISFICYIIKIILLLITLMILTNLSYASFPVTNHFNYVSIVPLDDGFKSLLWGILSIPFGFFVFPSFLSIKYGVSACNVSDYIASRIGFFLGLIRFCACYTCHVLDGYASWCSFWRLNY